MLNRAIVIVLWLKAIIPHKFMISCIAYHTLLAFLSSYGSSICIVLLSSLKIWLGCVLNVHLAVIIRWNLSILWINLLVDIHFLPSVFSQNIGAVFLYLWVLLRHKVPLVIALLSSNKALSHKLVIIAVAHRTFALDQVVTSDLHQLHILLRYTLFYAKAARLRVLVTVLLACIYVLMIHAASALYCLQLITWHSIGAYY